MDDMAGLQEAVTGYLERLVEHSEWIGEELASCRLKSYRPDRTLAEGYCRALEGWLRPAVGKAGKPDIEALKGFGVSPVSLMSCLSRNVLGDDFRRATRWLWGLLSDLPDGIWTGQKSPEPETVEQWNEAAGMLRGCLESKWPDFLKEYGLAENDDEHSAAETPEKPDTTGHPNARARARARGERPTDPGDDTPLTMDDLPEDLQSLLSEMAGHLSEESVRATVRDRVVAWAEDEAASKTSIPGETTLPPYEHPEREVTWIGDTPFAISIAFFDAYWPVASERLHPLGQDKPIAEILARKDWKEKHKMKVCFCLLKSHLEDRRFAGAGAFQELVRHAWTMTIRATNPDTKSTSQAPVPQLLRALEGEWVGPAIRAEMARRILQDHKARWRKVKGMFPEDYLNKIEGTKLLFRFRIDHLDSPTQDRCRRQFH